MTKEIEVCDNFKQIEEQAKNLGLEIRVNDGVCFKVIDCDKNVVAKAPTLDSLYYVLYGWEHCFEKYRNMIDRYNYSFLIKL